ncbi:MAG: hypothetical protein II165_05490 [Bacteroidales bacterium]|nr:hypothetical protein [Bacteroidales bacterium]
MKCKILFAFFIALMLGTVSCRDMLMERAAQEINAKCPSKSFQGFMLNSVEYQDNAFVFNVALEDRVIKEKLAEYGLSEDMLYFVLDLFGDQFTAKGSVKNFAKTLVDLSGRDDNYKTLIDLCVSEKVGAKFNLQIGNRQKSLFITSQDISDVVKN